MKPEDIKTGQYCKIKIFPSAMSHINDKYNGLIGVVYPTREIWPKPRQWYTLSFRMEWPCNKKVNDPMIQIVDENQKNRSGLLRFPINHLQHLSQEEAAQVLSWILMYGSPILRPNFDGE